MTGRIGVVDELTVKELRELKVIMENNLDLKPTYASLIEHIVMFHVIKDDNDKTIGFVAIKKPVKDFKETMFASADRVDVSKIHTHELGYMMVDKQWRKRGMAKELIDGIVKVYYEKFPMGKLYALCQYDNVASIKSLESQLFQVSVSKRGVENFVNLKTGNVLKLLLHRKKHYFDMLDRSSQI